jgi:hypothetical protein
MQASARRTIHACCFPFRSTCANETTGTVRDLMQASARRTIHACCFPFWSTCASETTGTVRDLMQASARRANHSILLLSRLSRGEPGPQAVIEGQRQHENRQRGGKWPLVLGGAGRGGMALNIASPYVLPGSDCERGRKPGAPRRGARDARKGGDGEQHERSAHERRKRERRANLMVGRAHKAVEERRGSAGRRAERWRGFTLALP